MRSLLAVVTIGVVLTAAPAAFAAKHKTPRLSHPHQIQAKKNQAKARKAVKQHKPNTGHRFN
jgi:hypothetical protein